MMVFLLDVKLSEPFADDAINLGGPF